MKLLDLIKEDINRLISQYKCKGHLFVRVKTIHGDMINTLGYRSVWECTKCGKRKTSKQLDEIK